MNLLELQRKFTEALTAPLNEDERMGERTLAGGDVAEIADAIVKPNDRLSSVERLEIYSRSYWFRIISSFNEDFVGLRAVIGDEKFDKLASDYLAQNPSRSWTLRNLGSRLVEWLRANPQYTAPHEQLALDISRLEWADTEAFDAGEDPPLRLTEIEKLGSDPVLHLQPHVQLLEVQYPVDDLLLHIREEGEDDADEASNTFSERRSRSRVQRVRKMKPKPAFVVVHRVDYSVYFKRVTAEQFRLLCAFRDGLPLSEAIDVAFGPSTLPHEELMNSMQSWFHSWAEWGWFSGRAIA